jgi:hypothetical protein
VLLFTNKKPTSHKADHNSWELGSLFSQSGKSCEYIVYSGFILPLLQVLLEQIGLVWRILLVGTDGFSLRSASRYFYFRCLIYHTLNLWYCNKVFLRLCVVWNGLSIVSLYSLLDPGCKTWTVRVLPLGVLDGIIGFSSLLGHLVSSGR